MNSNIDRIVFTVFDTETTGLDPLTGDRVVEIAAVKLKGNKRIGQFHSLINPRRDIANGAFAVNHITPEMLQGAPIAANVIPRFLDFIQESCLCSYSADFDLRFLNNELSLIGENPLEDILVIDILKMAKKLLPGLERYALWFVAEKLGIKNKQEHRAMSDVELTIKLFNELKRLLKQKEIKNFTNFCGLFTIDKYLLQNLNAQKITQIQEAINLGLELKIKYFSNSSAQVTERRVIPKEIRQEKKYTYLCGHCCLRDEERSFRIDGILHLEIV